MPLQECFRWPDRLVAALLCILGADHIRNSHLCRMRRASSFFSGLGTSELAWQIVGQSLLAVGLPFLVESIFACEKSEHCHEVLRDLPVQHVIGDIMNLLALETFDADWDYERKVKMIMSASIFLTAWCSKHESYCHIGPSDIDTSGSPCQDWSAAGLGLGVDGRHIHVFLAWVRWHLTWETPVIIHENVVNFDVALLHHFLGHLYHIFAVECGPEDVGFSFCRRRRRYVALIHKMKMRILHNPEIVFARVCTFLRCESTVEDLVMADPNEIHSEALALCHDRGVCLQSMARAVDVNGIHFVGRPAMSSASMEGASRVLNLSCALTAKEMERMEAYMHMWLQRFGTDARHQRGLVVNLGDNPGSGWITWSAPSSRHSHFCIPTLRRSWTVLWFPALNRWMTIKERLAMMGFPAYESLARIYRLNSIFRLPWHIAKQTIGNGMHLANVGVWQVVVAACVQKK